MKKRKATIKSIGLTPVEMIVESQALKYTDFNSLRVRYVGISLAKAAVVRVNSYS